MDSLQMASLFKHLQMPRDLAESCCLETMSSSRTFLCIFPKNQVLFRIPNAKSQIIPYSENHTGPWKLHYIILLGGGC